TLLPTFGRTARFCCASRSQGAAPSTTAPFTKVLTTPRGAACGCLRRRQDFVKVIVRRCAIGSSGVGGDAACVGTHSATAGDGAPWRAARPEGCPAPARKTRHGGDAGRR